MHKPLSLFSVLIGIAVHCFASPPVPFSGKIAVEGTNFHGTARFAFSIVDGEGQEHWRHAEDEQATIENFVLNGRYVVLLGGQGMQPLPPELFLEHDHLLLRVSVDLQDGAGMRLLQPDQPINSTPYALVADLAHHATVANGVSANGITHSMLSEEVRADLNRTIDRAQLSEDVLTKLDEDLVITREMLPEDVRNDLNRTITLNDLSLDVRNDLNRTITLADLDQQVVAELNDSVAPGSITSHQLSEQILKYIRPEIIEVPELPDFRQQVYQGQEIVLKGDADGKFLSYQWTRNGQPIPGATSAEYIISSANSSQHDGNYSLVASNDFGSVSTDAVELRIDSQHLFHQVESASGMPMIWIESGSFQMGQPGVIEPVRQVSLSHGFYLGVYEVTQAEYEAVMTGNQHNLSATPSGYVGYDDRPVEQVSHEDIQVFLSILNESEASNLPDGWVYALPTEAEWEYACRAGGSTVYSWGNDIYPDAANYSDLYLNQTIDVGQFAPNAWGLYDMHGNVFEWVSDWYDVYPSGDATDPEGVAVSDSRVIRGGSWYSDATSLGSAQRFIFEPNVRTTVLGFRLALKKFPKDVTSPEFHLAGGDNLSHLKGSPWVEPGVEAHDIRDGDLSQNVEVTGSVDVNTTGTYTLTYTVSDAAGNEASITRTVNVGIPANYATDLNSTVSLEMIWVEPGTFSMGQDGLIMPVHEVTLSNGFYLGKYEVTQAQYEAVMMGNTETDHNGDVISARPSEWPNNPGRPVEMVSWDDIQVFLTRLNAQEAGNIPAGWAYVLPTEAQWEYACRAGTTTAYSWGDSITTSDTNYNNSGQTTDVGHYSANPWGFFDMHGNVWEWTADAWGTYASGAQTDPFNAGAAGENRVFRGGAWNSGGNTLRSAYRGSNSPSARGSTLGFRVGFQQIPADVASPEMQIFGDANITHLQDTAWVDSGVEAHDVRDGNITDSITVSGSVDVNTTGTYTLTYTVSDAAGNEASITRTVHVGIPANYATDLNSTVSLEMIWVEPGTFTMGQDGVATPVHEVTLSNGFYLGKYEVTQAQYEAVMTGNTETNSSGHVISATPSEWPNNPNRPVEKVSWDDVQVFLTRLNAQEAGNIPAGWAYVLPTEAQWEYACRAGTTTAYSWGDTITSEDANYNNTIAQTTDVGQYSANPWGFFDMHGNVWEWTADAGGTYASGAQTDPFNAGAPGSNRVRRGGSWANGGARLRSADRVSDAPSNRNSNLGFRVGLMED
jgi:formylglycine-generating enzyme required for sulfatase activity